MGPKVLLELSRYLLRAVVSRPTEIRVDHIHAGGVDFLFLAVAKPDQKALNARDKEALVLVLERIGKKLGREVIADWK
ncbi:MAG: hypothetical protein NZ924_02305 [Candidatus Bipolaricaulota bacterium]|nr:hypothetical protein [Candidatus Bipolaricaulota bacterium]MDW8151741.1 hypothetical protein [Candidatus Bipolaricaulota bacterium]